MDTDPQKTLAPQTIVLGGGCFWCTEATLRTVPGVLDVTCGYAQGHLDHPDYAAVCRGDSGHAEVVQVRFDPAVVSLARVLEVFFASHDPTTPNRQGADVGHQYRSGIYVADAAQEQAARAAIAALPGGGVGVVTEVEPLRRLWPAEEEHQRYFERHPDRAYCRVVIEPKVRALRERG